MARKYQVIVKTDILDAPKEHELSAALILANYFKADAIFLRPQIHRTPDVQIKNTKWEIKSPRGDGKKTIENNFRTARGQSSYIVIDLRRSKMHQSKAKARIGSYLSKPHHFKQVLLITKSGGVVEIQ